MVTPFGVEVSGAPASPVVVVRGEIDVATSPTHTGPVVAERLTEERYVARETAAYLSYQWQRLTGSLPSTS